MIIGITGSIGTGKSFVGNYFKQLGYYVIDTDKINNELLSKKKHIKNINLLLFNKKSDILNKKDVRDLVFTNLEAKAKLEHYLHPLIFKKVFKKIKRTKELIFIEVPLLYETDFIYLVDQVIVVHTDLKTQLTRLKERNQLTEKEITQIIENQMPLADKMKKADYLIDNNKSKEEVEKDLKKLLDKLLRRL